jgi:hypothetical protein
MRYNKGIINARIKNMIFTKISEQIVHVFNTKWLPACLITGLSCTIGWAQIPANIGQPVASKLSANHPDIIAGSWCSELRKVRIFSNIVKTGNGTYNASTSYKSNVTEAKLRFLNLAADGKLMYSDGKIEIATEYISPNEIRTTANTPNAETYPYTRCDEAEKLFNLPAEKRSKNAGDSFEYREYTWRIIAKTAGGVEISTTGIPGDQIATEAADILCKENDRVAQLVRSRLVAFAFRNFTFNCSK